MCVGLCYNCRKDLAAAENHIVGKVMKVLNLGSLNLDYVYTVDHIILPGETEATGSRNIYLGGKGMNQSCALAKAGVEVYHGGLIGSDGGAFLEACKEYGVHSDFIRTVEGPSGHTVIQIDKNAQNSILLYGGANQMLTTDYVDQVLEGFEAGDILLLQNEVPEEVNAEAVKMAPKHGVRVIFNPAPPRDNVPGDLIMVTPNEQERAYINPVKYENCITTLGGDGCDIKLVQYSDEIEISPNAKVEKVEKI